jgi:hypothetical protein
VPAVHPHDGDVGTGQRRGERRLARAGAADDAEDAAAPVGAGGVEEVRDIGFHNAHYRR